MSKTESNNPFNLQTLKWENKHDKIDTYSQTSM